MSRLIVLLILAACTADPATRPNLTLAERFELVALRTNEGTPQAELIKWNWPIRVRVTGSEQYKERVTSHLELLGELTGLPTEMDSNQPNMFIDFGPSVEEAWCQARITGRGGQLRSQIRIRTDQPATEIGRCIVQEMTQSLGLLRDLDGRTDTNFTSYGFSVTDLTEIDRQLVAILYDPRLRPGMLREKVLEILPEIIADL